jgi:hypothetical protein
MTRPLAADPSGMLPAADPATTGAEPNAPATRPNGRVRTSSSA